MKIASQIMDNFRYGKWGSWIAPLCVLFSLLSLITAQPGFLSISCGAKTNHTDENNITWVTDVDYIDIGERGDIGDATEEGYGSYLHSLRYFPQPLNNSCYQLPLAPHATYLLRLWFVVGNFSGFDRLSESFSLSIETVTGVALLNVSIPSNWDAVHLVSILPISYEMILVSIPSNWDTVLYICLVRIGDFGDPFISAIELRRLEDDMYQALEPISNLRLVVLNERFDLGGNSTVRYPHDKFDRIWTPYANAEHMQNISTTEHMQNISTTEHMQNISTTEPILTGKSSHNRPPTAVMQTALVLNGFAPFDLTTDVPDGDALVVLYFAEIEMTNVSKLPISFSILVNGDIQKSVTLVQSFSVEECSLSYEKGHELYNFEVRMGDPNSMHFPIINAYEYYSFVDMATTTNSQDRDALNAMKKIFNIKDWISDPCRPIPWNGVGCDDQPRISSPRISRIDLSGRNLTGSVPNDMAQLTALVNLSLDHNHFRGIMPNLNNLVLLEGLYLQNNELDGTLEWLSNLGNLKELYLQNNKFNGDLEWLSKLKSLTVLNIQNNNFNGVIPQQLLLNCSLKVEHSGNPHLPFNKRECTPQNSNKNKMKVVLGITLSGIVIITSVVGMVTKCTKKTDECSIINIPNPTKSHAFTLEEMIVATKNFSREIGRGGFGSVFFGKLPEGKTIAVKVLSLSSRQGIHEFLNEVDLLSKISHRNLVSLLGYCNETRKPMLIYEHMSGGSLKDLLYGPNVENSDLQWKRRLKISLAAAQGMEYLHVGCTPKIIHRDIKPANILLDSNFKGKLADFGLSKMTIDREDQEATHVTTTVKGTFGYLDPEYFNTGMLTEKSDVYSFGVVLLEMICGRPPINNELTEEDKNIIPWVASYLVEIDENGGKIIEIIDKRLCGGYALKSMITVAKLAMRCVETAPSLRPTVSEIVGELKHAINHEDKDYVTIAEESSDLVASSKRDGMEWNDNSSNIPNEGR